MSTGSHEIMHLHSADEADLRLTRPVIDRMKDAFEESGQVHADPNGDWVSVRLESDHDVDLLLSLVSVAIQVSAETPQDDPDIQDTADGIGGSAPLCRTGGTRISVRAERTVPTPRPPATGEA